MSSYWAGYSGAGLMLNRSEFSGFLEKYMDKNPMQAEDLEEYLTEEMDEEVDEGLIPAVECVDLDEICFLKSIHAGEKIPNLQKDAADHIGKVMYFCGLSEDNVEGVMMWPFRRPDGRKNVNVEQPDGTWEYAESHSKDSDCCILWSENEFCGPEVFDKPAYRSYEEFVQEFKDNLEAYLPEDFDWDAHLGFISYAAYA